MKVFNHYQCNSRKAILIVLNSITEITRLNVNHKPNLKFSSPVPNHERLYSMLNNVRVSSP